jgi:hypothetical protein
MASQIKPLAFESIGIRISSVTIILCDGLIVAKVGHSSKARTASLKGTASAVPYSLRK